MLFLIITLFHVDKIIFWPTVCGYIYRTQFLDPPSERERSVNYLFPLFYCVLRSSFVIHNTYTHTYIFWVDSFLDPNKK